MQYGILHNIYCIGFRWGDRSDWFGSHTYDTGECMKITSALPHDILKSQTLERKSKSKSTPYRFLPSRTPPQASANLKPFVGLRTSAFPSMQATKPLYKKVLDLFCLFLPSSSFFSFLRWVGEGSKSLTSTQI